MACVTAFPVAPVLATDGDNGEVLRMAPHNGEVLRMALAFPFEHLDPTQDFGGGFYGVSENLTRTNLEGEVELTLLESLEQPAPPSGC